MENLETAGAGRDAQGRFAPGCSGNPAGKTPGTRNRATVVRELVEEGVAAEALQVVVTRMREGDVVAARFLVDRLLPKPRGRAIALGLPDDIDAADSPAAVFDAALRAMVSGEITLDEATQLGKLLQDRHARFADTSRPAASAPAAPVPREAPAPTPTPTPAPPAPAFRLYSQVAAGAAPTPPIAPATPPIGPVAAASPAFQRRRPLAAALLASTSLTPAAAAG